MPKHIYKIGDSLLWNDGFIIDGWDKVRVHALAPRKWWQIQPRYVVKKLINQDGINEFETARERRLVQWR